MSSIVDGNVVEMNYKLTDDAGNLIDTTEGFSPLAYIQGKQNIIPGLEKELLGKKAGDKFSATIKPEDAYGLRSDDMTQAVPKEQFGPNAENIAIGTEINVEDQDGNPFTVTVADVKENEIILDANHPLAGITLHFEVEVVSVRDATSEELNKGFIEEERPPAQG